MVVRVFISHASGDIALAREVYGWLEDDHHEVFLARDLRDGIAVGEQWRQRLHKQLRGADAVVCLVTSAYLASTWCTAEVAIAQSLDSVLLPVLAEPGVVHPFLTDVQHTDWTQNSRAALAEALRRIDDGGGFGWPDDQFPFPGLRPFDVDQHRVFFGRSDEVGQLAELLRSPAE